MITLIMLAQVVTAPGQGWIELADKGAAGVIIGVIFSSLVAFGFLTWNQRMTLGAYAKDAKRADERLANMISLVENQQVIMTEVITANTKALTEVSAGQAQLTRAVDGIAAIVASCPERTRREDDKP